MIKERLKELDIKITELASYLSISRPTMYKFIEMYDEGNKKELTNSISLLFDYIEQNDLIDKKNVVSYILTNIASIEDAPLGEEPLAKNISDCLKSSDSEIKKQIMEYLINNNDLDELFAYLIEASISSNKKKKTKKDDAKTQSLQRIIGIYKKDIKEKK